MKKKLTTAILLASVLMLTLIGCGKKKADATLSGAEASTEAISATATPEATTEVSEEKAEEETKEKEEAPTKLSESDAPIEIDGDSVSILGDAKETIEKLDKAVTPDKDHTDKKAKDGVRMYSYEPNKSKPEAPGITVVTYDDDGEETIGQIEILKEGIKTSKGIGIGSSKDEVLEAYGKPHSTDSYGDTTVLTYEADNFYIQFTIEGKVTSIMYLNPEYFDGGQS